ncbi:MAG: hypothetical protein Q7J10_03645 [Methanosarcinaceae archaeon]|nr:hypothetical protein [Methanosarcinaceae archaeon]
MSGEFKQAWAIWWNYLATVTVSLMALNEIAKMIAQLIPFIYDLSRYIQYSGML